jgi:hypothetical protein
MMKRQRQEHEEQCAFFSWIRLHEKRHPELKRFFAIPNGQRRDHGVAIQLYLEGVRAGVLDTHLPMPRQGKTGLWIEFKAGRNTLTPDQVAWREELQREGHAVFVVYSWIEAARITAAYLELPDLVPAATLATQAK